MEAKVKAKRFQKAEVEAGFMKDLRFPRIEAKRNGSLDRSWIREREITEFGVAPTPEVACAQVPASIPWRY